MSLGSNIAPLPLDPRAVLADAVRATGLALDNPLSAQQAADALIASGKFQMRIHGDGRHELIAASGRSVAEDVRTQMLTNQACGRHLAATPENQAAVLLTAAAASRSTAVAAGGGCGLGPRRY